MAVFWLNRGKKKEFEWPQPIEEKKSPLSTYQQNANITKEKVKITYAHQLMRSPVKTLLTSTTVRDAQEFLRSYRIRHIPILNPANNQIEGILSDRDILRKWAGIEDTFIDWIQKIDNSNVIVAECMTTKVLVVNPNERIVDIARVMFSEKIGCVPVVNEQNKIVGIITRSDILRMIISTTPIDTWL